MKILLINAPHDPPRSQKFRTPETLPLGLPYLAGYIHEKEPSLKILVIDGVQEGISRSLKKIRKFAPDLIGISFNTTQAFGAYNLMESIRQILPRTPIIVGGAHPTALPEDPIKNSYADISIPGEGEKTFMELIDLYRKSGFFDAAELKDIPGIHFRNGSLIEKTNLRPMIPNIDSIPEPSRDLVTGKYRSEFQGRKLAAVLHFRFYPFPDHLLNEVGENAQFPIVRFRAVKSIVQEMINVLDNHGINEFIFCSTPFNLDNSLAFAICEEIMNRDLKVFWRAELFPMKFSDDLLTVMKKSGCFHITFQVPANYDDDGSNGHAGQNPENIYESIRMIKQHKFYLHGNFNLFNSWIDDDAIRFDDDDMRIKTVRFAQKLNKKRLMDSFQFSFGAPFPGTPQYSNAVKFQSIRQECVGSWKLWDGETLVLDVPGLSEKNLNTLQKEIKMLEKESGKINLPASVTRLITQFKK